MLKSVKSLRSLRSLSLGAAMVGALAACSDGTGVGANSVALNFQVAGPSASPAPGSGAGALTGPARVAGPPLVLVGTNGTLSIEEIRIVVSEVEIEAASGSCLGADDSSDDVGDGCEEFDTGPRFLDLPLDGAPIEVATDVLPSGTYDELEFEIEDLEDDEDDSVEGALIAAVRAQILAVVPDWPNEASALVTGSFTPTGGSSVDFRVFLKAEIEIEMELVPNLVVEGGVASRALTVDIDTDIWFTSANGSVLDLSQYDYDATGQLLEFDVEMEDGFTKVEVEG
jgi:hypothetical protein